MVSNFKNYYIFLSFQMLHREACKISLSFKDIFENNLEEKRSDQNDISGYDDFNPYSAGW